MSKKVCKYFQDQLINELRSAYEGCDCPDEWSFVDWLTDHSRGLQEDLDYPEHTEETRKNMASEIAAIDDWVFWNDLGKDFRKEAV